MIQDRHFEAGQWSIKAVVVFRRSDPHYAGIVEQYFSEAYDAADENEKNQLKTLWQQANLGAFP